MPHTIAFDTNYLISFGGHEYRAGEVPQKLHDQIKAALARGDLVIIPETVRLETNAWLKRQSDNAAQKLAQAKDLLQRAGHTITPDKIEAPPEVDILAVLNRSFPDVHLLSPTLADYKDAELRTSYRREPLPKKPDAEEFRDRIIWSQLVNHSKAGAAPILMVSGDILFKNGAKSDEGKSARIEVVEDESDLDQWLDQRPQHIQFVIDQVLAFGAELEKHGIVLPAENITSIGDLRNVYDPNGLLVQRFTLRTTDISGMPSTVRADMVSLGSIPLSLNLAWHERTIDVHRKLTAPEMEQLARAQFQSTMDYQQTENELRTLIGRQS